MPEQLQKILDRVVEWWKKFSNKQRMLLISLTAVVILALVILGVVVSRPSYTTLIDCQNAKEASQVKDLLDGEGDIDYKVTDTTHFEVNKKDENKANWLLGSNNIDTTGFDLSDPNIKDYIDGSFSTTEADKQKLAKSYMEDKLENVLAANDLIDSAKVTLDIPDDDGTLISRMQESSASVSLALNGSRTRRIRWRALWQPPLEMIRQTRLPFWIRRHPKSCFREQIRMMMPRLFPTVWTSKTALRIPWSMVSRM